MRQDAHHAQGAARSVRLGAGGVSEGRAGGNRATSHQAPQAFTLREMRSIQVLSRGMMQPNILKGTLGPLG